MTTAIDTNVIVALWDRDENPSAGVLAALEAATQRGPLIISVPVFSELGAAPGRREAFVGSFLADTGIVVELVLGESVWRLAAQAFHEHAARRRRRPEPGPRRILADLLIGAHALVRGCRLLTRDDRLYRAAFPELEIVTT
jgi:predicted nucleic acid-binding protein